MELKIIAVCCVLKVLFDTHYDFSGIQEALENIVKELREIKGYLKDNKQ